METINEQIREICTYHSDDGTSGYCLSEAQFGRLEDLLEVAYDKANMVQRKAFTEEIDKALREVKGGGNGKRLLIQLREKIIK